MASPLLSQSASISLICSEMEVLSPHPGTCPRLGRSWTPGSFPSSFWWFSPLLPPFVSHSQLEFRSKPVDLAGLAISVKSTLTLKEKQTEYSGRSID